MNRSQSHQAFGFESHLPSLGIGWKQALLASSQNSSSTQSLAATHSREAKVIACLLAGELLAAFGFRPRCAR
jgi:hypothetical protein